MNSENLINRSSALARMWATRAPSSRPSRAARALGRLVADPQGLEFATEFVDLVSRPEDTRAAAKALADLDSSRARFLSPLDKGLLGIGKGLAPHLPGAVVPAATARLRAMVGHLVVDAGDRSLTRHLASTLAKGQRVNLNLLGETVLGEKQARQRAEQVKQLLARPDVDYISVKVSSLASQLNTWDVEGEAGRVGDRLRSLFTQAMGTTPHKFVTLDMEDYQDLALTIRVFEEILSEPEFMHFSAGIALQAYLPESYEAVTRLIDFSTARVKAGGAPIKIRLVKGANLAMEAVHAEMNGWPRATYGSKQDVDGHFLRLVEMILRPEVAYAVRLGLASHNLFHLAYAHLLAEDRGVQAALDIEMLHGMAPAEVQAVAADVANPVILYTPVVRREEFHQAVAYLVRRLQEAAGPGNFLHDAVLGDLHPQETAFLEAATHTPPVGPRRSHTRAPVPQEFVPTPNSDPAIARTRAVMGELLDADLPHPSLPELRGTDEVDDIVERARANSATWAARSAPDRARILRAVAQELEDRRYELIGVMAKEAGKTVAEADAEVSEAVDFARYYAQQAQDLESMAEEQGLRFTPDRVVVVTPPWNFPLAIPVGGLTAALAAGSAVIMKPAPQTPLTAQVAAEAVHAALVTNGVDTDLAQVVLTDEGATGRALVAHDGVDTVILTGSYSTARLFTSLRVHREKGPRVFAETSGKNAIIVTPAADYDLAIRDVIHSAFSHAGQKCSAASLVILVGSVGASERFRSQLVDAVESMYVDWPTNLAARIGPLISEPEGRLRDVLTELGEGEHWLVKPHSLDDAGRLWRPGVKIGVEPGSAFHLTEYFGPVLGIMTADTLEQAIEWQNGTDYGLTAGLHSLDEDEVTRWLDQARAGNLYVNRATTGAIVGRQPFGGWKHSNVGPGAKAGGPNYIAQLGTWSQQEPPSPLGGAGPRVEQFLTDTATWLDADDRDWLATAAASDAHVRDVLRTPVDLAGLRYESNIFHYRPGPRITIRAGAGASLVHVLRLQAAALAAGVDAGVSVAPDVFEQLPGDVQDRWRTVNSPSPTGEGTEEDGPATDGVPAGVDMGGTPLGVIAGWQVETLGEFTTRASTWTAPGRIRVLDLRETPAIAEAVSTAVTVLPGEVLLSGARELLTFLSEQSVSRTQHRYGQIRRGRGAASA